MSRRIPLLDDHINIARCITCDEYDTVDNLIPIDGQHVHEDSKCGSGFLRCTWCGDAVDKAEAEDTQDGKMHPACVFQAAMAERNPLVAEAK